MSILLPFDKNWLVSRWISFGFFEDAVKYANPDSLLREKLEFCLKAQVDTFDISDADLSSILECRQIVEQVISDNEETQGKNFQSKDVFPIYMSKLKELEVLLNDIIVRMQNKLAQDCA